MKNDKKKKFRIGRVFSIITSLMMLSVSLQSIDEIDRISRFVMLVPLSIAAWLFYLGRKNVFDYRINGETYYDEYDMERNVSKGGFVEHCTAAAFVFVPLCAIDTFVFFGHSITKGLYWLVPIVLIILSIIGLTDPEDDEPEEEDGEWYKLY